MKEQKYVPPQERDDIVQLYVFADVISEIAGRTPVTRWSRKLNTAATYLKNILVERVKAMSDEDCVKVDTRRKRTNVIVYTSGETRMLEDRLGLKDKTFKMDAENWVVMCEAVDNFICRKCKQGDKVKGCELRKILHKSFAPVYIGDPKEGECEFHWDSNCKDLDIEVEEE